MEKYQIFMAWFLEQDNNQNGKWDEDLFLAGQLAWAWPFEGPIFRFIYFGASAESILADCRENGGKNINIRRDFSDWEVSRAA